MSKYDMNLKHGMTCKECEHCERCCKMFGVRETNTSCDFYPNRFKLKEQEDV